MRPLERKVFFSLFTVTFIFILYSVMYQQITIRKLKAQLAVGRSRASSLNDWGEVPGSGGLWHVYSAHFSTTLDGKKTVILVTAIDVEFQVKTVFCHLWNSTDLHFTVKGKITCLPTRSKKITVAFVWCPVELLKTVQLRRVTVTPSEHTEVNFNDSLRINTYPEKFLSQKIYENQHVDSRFQQNQSSSVNNPINEAQHQMRGYKYNYEKWQYKNTSNDLVVCVRAIYGSYNNAAKIIEFVELHKILGVKFFIFYNYSIGADADEVLQFYVRRGDAEVLPWSLPEIVLKGIHAYGQVASQADCHLRASRFSLIAMLDLDEVFIPKENKSLIEMVDGVGYYASYLFANVFFHKVWKDDSTFVTPNLSSEMLKLCSSQDKFSEDFNSYTTDMVTPNCSSNDCPSDLKANKEEIEQYSSNPKICSPKLDAFFETQRKTKRVVAASPYRDRSKYIMRPQHVSFPNIHYVAQFEKDVPKNRQTYSVPASTALSHHYRNCANKKKCRTVETMTDRTALRFGPKLQSAVANVLFQLCKSRVQC